VFSKVGQVNSDVVRLPGLPETAMCCEDRVILPANAPPTPRWVTAHALCWTDRPDDRARCRK
jgi:hypothetical protein